VSGASYSQISLTDGCSGNICDANPKYGAPLTLARAVTYCEGQCNGRAGCTGFFFQKHNNGHEICGFYSTVIAANSMTGHGHMYGAVCLKPTAAPTPRPTPRPTPEPTPEPTTTTTTNAACSLNLAFDGGGASWQGNCTTLDECRDACKGGCVAFNWWPIKGGCRHYSSTDYTTRKTEHTTIGGDPDCVAEMEGPEDCTACPKPKCQGCKWGKTNATDDGSTLCKPWPDYKNCADEKTQGACDDNEWVAEHCSTTCNSSKPLWKRPTKPSWGRKGGFMKWWQKLSASIRSRIRS